MASPRSRYDRYYERESEWAPYVTVGERREKAAREAKKLAKRGTVLDPVRPSGRTIAASAWGKAWCTHIEGYHDASNRLPRGRSYLRNGSVIHLAIAAGRIEAKVSGSEIYRVVIDIPHLAPARWKAVIEHCTGRIDSVVELLAGRLSDGVMQRLCDANEGLFPGPRQLAMRCSCPDGVRMCKHVAAVLYGVGCRLDRQPELLFVLRGVSHDDLVVRAASESLTRTSKSDRAVIANEDLGAIFGIDLDGAPADPAPASKPLSKSTLKSRPKQAAKPAPESAAKRTSRPIAKAPERVPATPAQAPKRRERVRVTTSDLLARGVPRSTFQNWLTEGVLEPTGERGVYFTTPQTEERIRRVLDRLRGG